MQKKKYLITTPLIEARKQEHNYCYLHTWLLEITDNNEHSIDELLNQIDIYECLSKKIKLGLYDLMNIIHKKKKSYNYWDILLGTWVDHFIMIAIDRWKRIETFDDMDFTHVESPKYNYSDLADNTFEIFRERIQHDYWNSIFYARILDFKNKCVVEYKDINEKYKVNYNNSLHFNIFKNQQKHLFLNTYLGKLDEIYINLKLGQIPRFKRKFLVPPLYNYKEELRSIKKIFTYENKLEEFISKNIFIYLPKSFLEGFEQLDEIIKKENLPKNPKNIYCGIFPNITHILKYLAEKKESGAKIICGDHGGGVQYYSALKNYLKKHSNIYLTWSKINLKHNEKCIGYIKKRFKNNRPKNIVLFLFNHSRYIFKPSCHSILFSQNYIQKIKNFVGNFDENIQEKILLRLIGEDFWEQEKIYKKEFPNILFDKANIKISKVFNSAELIISTYNSTTIIEGIFNNIPSCLLVDEQEISKSIVYEKRKYYQLLQDVYILHTDPNKCARFLNQLFEDNTLNSWWNSKKTQNAINLFKENICPENKNLIQDITNYLKLN